MNKSTKEQRDFKLFDLNKQIEILKSKYISHTKDEREEYVRLNREYAEIRTRLE